MKDRVVTLALLIMTSILLNACGDSASGPTPKSGLRAEIRRTAGGIPHVLADDWESLGFGTGYVVAKDNLCLLAENYLRINGELSRFLGEADGNLDSDFFYKLLIDRGLGEDDIDPELTAAYRGYAKGYNRYLEEVGGAEGVNDPACQGASWVRPISESDVRRLNMVPFFLPNLIPIILPAAPPEDAAAPTSGVVSPTAADLEEIARLANPYDRGSNAFAFGRDLTASGRGMVIGNPHFDWQGVRRFYVMQQTIPDEFDMLGGIPVDRALVGFGMNAHVAWTNTVSTSQIFSFFQLELAPGDPTSYVVDGQTRAMTREVVRVMVRNEDGSLEERSHTFYSTDFGLLIGRVFPWTQEIAFAVRGTDEGNRGLKGGQLGFARATTVGEMRAVADRFAHVPANLVAADSAGDVLFMFPGPVVNVTDAQIESCAEFAGAALDGSRSACDWNTDPTAAAPGILGPADVPDLIRSDYVTNHNDSAWLTNPAQPLTGFPQVTSVSLQFQDRFFENRERTLRTRSGLLRVEEAITAGEPLTLDHLEQITLENRNHAGELLRDDLVTICEAAPTVSLPDGSEVDVTEACGVLAAWDLHSNLESRGAHLFREFLYAANGDDTGFRWLPAGLTYTVPFDASDPLRTPRGLDTGDATAAREALGTAVSRLREAGIALDARLGDIQSVTRNGEVIPIHGGPESTGVLNKVAASFVGPAGYPEVDGSSSSWIFLSDFTPAPRMRSVLAYSLSTDPTSPYFADQTRLYSQKDWIDIPFAQDDVRAETIETVILEE